MKSKCNARDGRLCYFNELCPQGGPNKAPSGGQQASKDMWSPIRTSASDARPNWVQVGNRAGGMCNKLTAFHAADIAGSWMVTNQDTPYKGIYPCCPKRESLTGSLFLHLLTWYYIMLSYFRLIISSSSYLVLHHAVVF